MSPSESANILIFEKSFSLVFKFDDFDEIAASLSLLRHCFLFQQHTVRR